MLSDQTVSELSKCIETLEFISKIPENHKPYYSSKTTIAKDAWFATTRRRLGGEKGENGIVHVNKILDSCDYHYRMCLQAINSEENKDTNLETLRKIKRTLDESIKGFDNLINTYSDQSEVHNDYIKCKSKTNSISNNIFNAIKKINSINCDDPTSLIYENDEYGGIMSQLSTGWGYLNEDTDGEKNLMIPISSDSGNDKKSPFFTSNMTLMKTKKSTKVNNK